MGEGGCGRVGERGGRGSFSKRLLFAFCGAGRVWPLELQGVHHGDESILSVAAISKQMEPGIESHSRAPAPFALCVHEAGTKVSRLIIVSQYFSQAAKGSSQY